MVGAAPHLSIRPGIQLQLTPQLQQALRLLQLSSLELQQKCSNGSWTTLF